MKKSTVARACKITGLFFCLLAFVFSPLGVKRAKAMPFYDLQPKSLVVMAEFSTYYTSSSKERKNNIELACKSLDNVFIDVGGEFSFNRTVGQRTVKRGYQKANIIVGGQFEKGVGGGVCQVSTTLYNAVLLAGLKVTEFHPHSLMVGYVAPSFDAMVNSGSADLRFVNNTHNPVIIKSFADGEMVKFTIVGEPLTVKYCRESRVIEYLDAGENILNYDDKGEFPDLYEGEQRVISYPKRGCKSVGKLIKVVNGNRTEEIIRKDRYSPVKGITVIGRAIPKTEQSTGEEGLE